MYIHKVYTLVDYSAIPYVESVESPRASYHLVYTLGKLEIFKLREDYKKKMGRPSASNCGWRIETEAVKRLDPRNALR